MFTALFVEENRKFETKHSLVDTQVQDDKVWIPLTFLSQNTMSKHKILELGQILATKENKLDLRTCEAR